jgi:hypothetical protein
LKIEKKKEKWRLYSRFRKKENKLALSLYLSLFLSPELPYVDRNLRERCKCLELNQGVS